VRDVDVVAIFERLNRSISLPLLPQSFNASSNLADAAPRRFFRHALRIVKRERL